VPLSIELMVQVEQRLKEKENTYLGNVSMKPNERKSVEGSLLNIIMCCTSIEQQMNDRYIIIFIRERISDAYMHDAAFNVLTDTNAYVRYQASSCDMIPTLTAVKSILFAFL